MTLWFRREKIALPAIPSGRGERRLVWKLPLYHTIWAILTNPLYAGAYAFGKTEARMQIVEGRAHRTRGHCKPRAEWMVLIRDHHAGYISWEQYEKNQAMIAANAHMKSHMEPKAARGGRALLAGLLRCRRCGRMLRVEYGSLHMQGRYCCRDAQANAREDCRCISFGSWRPDEAVAKEVLEAIGGNAVEAALQAAEQMRQQQEARQRASEMEVEQARYEARLGGAALRSGRSGATVSRRRAGSSLECGFAEGTRFGEEAADTRERPTGGFDSCPRKCC